MKIDIKSVLKSRRKAPKNSCRYGVLILYPSKDQIHQAVHALFSNDGVDIILNKSCLFIYITDEYASSELVLNSVWPTKYLIDHLNEHKQKREWNKMLRAFLKNISLEKDKIWDIGWYAFS